MDRVEPARQVFATIADTVRTSRLRLGWSQRELSRRSGVSQSQISQISLIEHAQHADVRMSVIDRLFSIMGLRYWLRIDVGVAGSARQTDLAHARCVIHAERRLKAAGWLVEREVEIGGDRSRGWIDLLAFDPTSGSLLVIEVKTEVRDVGAVERTMNWYRREAWAAARRFGWRPRLVGSALLILQTAANDRLISANRDVFASSLPIRAETLRMVVNRSTPLTDARGLALIDPRSRRAAWLRPTRADGRRSPAPYANYIDFVRQVG